MDASVQVVRQNYPEQLEGLHLLNRVTLDRYSRQIHVFPRKGDDLLDLVHISFKRHLQTQSAAWSFATMVSHRIMRKSTKVTTFQSRANCR